MVYKRYHGSILIHILLLLISKGLLNIAYLWLSWRGKKSQYIYLRTSKGTATTDKVDGKRRQTTSRKTVPGIIDVDYTPVN